ncbi:YbaK / prolyl-tRNA synthetases associated domain containing protein, putative [Eimeria brunetti]|uniref:YbaK / prolyl-tRNA synthetases associated domain containing protein, putative n=1 Tax=Eimeria brunetti TaxID=51314 RepID=U6M1Q3_9EIME|nr:YbaK / prolyl-tRNA synthetases associated domain containing protein, putative [Eimeria brunetti]
MTTTESPPNPYTPQGPPQGPQGAPQGTEGGPQGPPESATVQQPVNGGAADAAAAAAAAAADCASSTSWGEYDLSDSVEQEQRMLEYFAADAAALAADPAAAAAAAAAAAETIAAVRRESCSGDADTPETAETAEASETAETAAAAAAETAAAAAETPAPTAAAAAAAAAAAGHKCIFRLFRINPKAYYSVSDLSERLEMLGAASVNQLCKTIVVENTKQTGPEDRLNSRYYLVVLQYQDKLNGERVKDLIKAENAKVGRRLGNKKLNFNFCNSFESLTGFKRNGVTALNPKSKTPVIISIKLFFMQQQIVFLGGGAPDLKLELPLLDLVRLTNPIIGVVS